MTLYHMSFPLILVEVPHFLPPSSFIIDGPGELVLHASERSGLSSPPLSLSHIERTQDGVSFLVEPDDALIEQLFHELHTAYLLEKSEWERGWRPSSEHQSRRVLRLAESDAHFLGWEQNHTR